MRRVPADVHKALKLAAVERGIEMNDVILEALATAAKGLRRRVAGKEGGLPRAPGNDPRRRSGLT